MITTRRSGLAEFRAGKPSTPRAAAREGADIVACDILDQIPSVAYPLATPAGMDETARLVTAAGGKFVGLKADVHALGGTRGGDGTRAVPALRRRPSYHRDSNRCRRKGLGQHPGMM